MAYYEVSLLARDPDFQSRIAACYGTETMAQDPESWALMHQWIMASQPGFGDAYTYALNSGVPNPGRDPAVITDAQILTAVQMIIIEEETEPDHGNQQAMIINEEDLDHA
jgi:hypothetical protein